MARFLLKAKRSTYASGAKGQTLLRGGQQFYFQDGILSYWDTFYGFDPFIGQELVWSHDQGLVWAMNYYGGLIHDLIHDNFDAPRASPDKTYEFLKKALLASDIKAPFRGPKHFSDGQWLQWVYENDCSTVNGIGEFYGTEDISYKSLVVYRCNYHGGFVKEK